MLILKNCPQDPQLLRFIKFCESKFEFKYPVTLNFKDTLRGNFNGVYRPNRHHIDINKSLARTKFEVLVLLAHEIRHAYQHMYNTPEWQSSPKICERDAVVWSHTILEEFGELEQDMKVWTDRLKSKVSWFDVMHEPN